MDVKNDYGISIISNQHYKSEELPEFLNQEHTMPVLKFHQSLKGYEPTPLVRLDGLAELLHLKAVFVKDESRRFGLKAFKGLGGVYALTKVVCKELGLDIEKITFQELCSDTYSEQIKRMVFVTATDGNHGKGVSWAAGLLGCKAYVYMPKGSAKIRAEAIQNAGRAEVTITDKGYDDTVRYASEMAEEKGWYLVQDTSWDGYTQIPTWIIQGYTTMASEAAQQLEAEGFPAPTHVFVQAGVGAMAGGVTGYLANRYHGQMPVFATAEPEDMACIFASIKSPDGAGHAVTGECHTIMAGLNCGEPCTVSWPVLRNHVRWSFSCPDETAALGMRILAAPIGDDLPVISGESGAVTTGLLALLASCPQLEEIRSAMGLNEDSVVLLFNTEGDTDPENYQRIVYGGAHALL